MTTQFGNTSGGQANQFGWTYGGGGSGVKIGLLKINVVLSGTLTTTFLTEKSGTYNLIITTNITGAPELSCTISKRKINDPSETANHHARNADDTTALQLVWGPNQYMQLKKTTGSFNGIYTIVVVGDV